MISRTTFPLSQLARWKCRRRCITITIMRRTAHTQTSTVLDELDQRGFIAATTSPKLNELVEKPTTIYCGVDPSASSLHVGNLLPLMGLLHFHLKGHQAICLIGGATGSIGDPSGRSTERKSLSSEELQRNVEGITGQVNRFFNRGEEHLRQLQLQSEGDRKGKGKEDEVLNGEENGNGNGRMVKVVNNLDWTKDVSLLDFLTGVGKVARVSTMLSRDSVKNRLTSDSGISYTEFTYQLLQAFDFSHLYDKYGCQIQLGGSDQWGNIVAGIDLIKRLRQNVDLQVEGEENEEGEGVEAYGLTIPLLTTSTGEKFGKSAGNAVWLDGNRTSPAEFYQFFLRTTDDDVEKYLKLFTFLPSQQITTLMAEHKTSPSDRRAQRKLAEQVTELVHGAPALRCAQTAATVLYSTSISELIASDVLSAFDNDNRLIKISQSESESMDISKLVVKIGLCQSRGEATRLISNSALYLNSQKISDPRMKLDRNQLIDGQIGIFRIGTKRHIILHVV